MKTTTILMVCSLLAGASAAAAQTPPPPRAAEPKLSFDREVFSYSAEGRRDPFRPLSGTDALGPLYEDLQLRGIIFSRDPAQSVVAVTDGTKKMYRLRTGDVLGNARVAEIQPRMVRWQVQSYGMIREEVMPLAVRQPVADVETTGNEDTRLLDRLLQQEFLRALQGTRLDSARRAPPVRRDTSNRPVGDRD
jgi:hypothetical protein